jgi:hypothetical protein
MGREDTRGTQHGVNEGGFPVVDVRDQSDVAEGGTGHGGEDGNRRRAEHKPTDNGFHAAPLLYR